MEIENPAGVHATLFERQEELDDMEPDQMAERAISDSDGRTALYNCLQDDIYEEHLQNNLTLGEQLNLTRVPALIINGERYFGALSERMLSNIIESHL